MVNCFNPKVFAIVGAGPSGCVLAAFLAQGGYTVILCDLITDLIKPAVTRGIIIEGCESIKYPVTHISTTIEDVIKLNPDVIFIATKATAISHIAKTLSKYYINDKGIYVVSWQNGIDTEKEISKYISDKWIIRGVVNYGCSLIDSAHTYISFHHYPHYLQELNSESIEFAKIIANSISLTGLSVKHTNKIQSMIWRKSILNASMNPVCALTGLTMYESMNKPYIKKIVESLVKECILVAEGNNIDIGNDFYNYAINYMSNAGNHKPSMLMDIENNRATEIKYINGKFEQYGNKAGIKTPYNSIFNSLVKGRESSILDN